MVTDSRAVGLRAVFGIAAVIVLCTAAQAGWLPETRLTVASGASYLSGNNAHCLVTGLGGDLHLVWYDYRDGEAEIYYRRFTGFDWTPEVRLTSSDYSSEYPALAAGEAGTLDLVWSRYEASGGRIIYKHFDGTTWGSSEAISDFASASERPSVAVDDVGKVHVVWREYSGGVWHIYHKVKDGAVWSVAELLSDATGYPRYPSIAAGPGGEVHVTWDDYRHGNWEIYYRLFDGAVWQAEERLTTDAAASESPAVLVDSDGSVHVFWDDNRGGSATIYHKMNDGMGWSADEAIVVPDEAAVEPYAVAGDSGRMYIAWNDKASGNSEIYYQQFDGSSWMEKDLISEANAIMHNPATAVDGNGIEHVLWHSDRPGNFEIYWKANLDIPKPEITSIEPDSAYAYQDVHIVDLAGTGFFSGALVRLEKAGESNITATNVFVESDVRITCDFSLGVEGYWDVIVENIDGQADTLTGGFYAVPLPGVEVVSIEPDMGMADENVHITDLSGMNFFPGAEVRLMRAGETDIKATNVTVEAMDRITCDFGLTAADSGYWDVVVRNIDGAMDTLVTGFRVLEGLWGEDVRLTEAPNASATSKPNARCIVLDSMGYSHVVWQDYRDLDYDIYYKEFDGVSWGFDVPLTALSTDARYPAIAIDRDDHIHVVWADRRDGNWEIYYKKRDEGGWHADERLTDAANASEYPSIACKNGCIYVVWQDARDGSPKIYFRQHNGTAWLPEESIAPDIGGSGTPAVAVDGFNHVHVVWYQDNDTDDHLYYKSYDGTLWSDLVTLEATRFIYDPSITVDNRNRVHVAWSDWRYGHEWDYEIFYRCFNGLTWDPVERITEAPENSRYPSVATDDSGNVYLAWMDELSGLSQIYYARNDGAGWTPGVRLTDAGAQATYPSLAAGPDGDLHLIWQDRRDGNWEIYYKLRGVQEYSGLDAVSTMTPFAGRLSVAPNPASSGMTARFDLARKASVDASVFDIRGRIVSQIALGSLAPGNHMFVWDMTDGSGSPVAPGIYFVSINTGSYARSAKVIVLR